MTVAASGVPPLLQRDAVPLATAWVSALASAASIRMLVLKGPIAGAQGLRPDRASADVDVLVAPDDLVALLAQLAEAGWRARPARAAPPRILAQHAETVAHPDWPVDLDIHLHWPGFLVDPAEAFEVLWATRTANTVAHRTVWAPAVAAAALILGLNALRSRRRGDDGDTMPALAAAVIGLGVDPDEVLRFARLLGAVQTGRPLLALLGLEIVDDETMSDPRFLRWQLGSAVQLEGGWANGVVEATPRSILPLLWRAVFPSEVYLRTGADAREGDSVVRIWARRFRRGTATLPGGFRASLRARRARLHGERSAARRNDLPGDR